MHARCEIGHAAPGFVGAELEQDAPHGVVVGGEPGEVPRGRVEAAQKVVVRPRIVVRSSFVPRIHLANAPCPNASITICGGKLCSQVYRQQNGNCGGFRFGNRPMCCQGVGRDRPDQPLQLQRMRLWNSVLPTAAPCPVTS